ncbi:MAG TPA: tetratricopeptide repeat protein [Puia sp.]|nr:tetratricopeptide repeat protein [Puia sp.]
MNLSRSSHFIPLILTLLAILSCHSGSNRVAASPDQAVLNSPLLAPLNDSINRFPDNAQLYFRRAELLSLNNAHEAAAKDYKKSWELAPAPETAIQYASNLSINDMPAEKLTLLEDAVRKFPAENELNRLLGEAYAETGRSGEALDWYNRLLEKDPADFETWYEKGLLLLKKNDTARAIAALKRAYEIQPVNTYALELAQVYAERGNAEALGICDEVIARDSTRELADPFLIRGIYYAVTRQYEPALVQFDSCIRRDWKFVDAYIEKGIVFFKQKNYDEALNTFRMAATVSNTYPDAYYWMGRCYEVVNKKQDAMVNYERALELDKHFTEAREAMKRLKG